MFHIANQISKHIMHSVVSCISIKCVTSVCLAFYNMPVHIKMHDESTKTAKM